MDSLERNRFQDLCNGLVLAGSTFGGITIAICPQLSRQKRLIPYRLRRCMVSFFVYDSLLRCQEQPFPKIHYRKQSFATITQSLGSAFCHRP
jgi:hypothetical protein